MSTDNELAERVKAGDDYAFEELISRHHNLIYSRALRYQGRTIMDMDDLVSVATIAFFNACLSYDPTQGAKLTTYAVHRMRDALTRSARIMTEVPMPHFLTEDITKYERADGELYQILKREATDEEMAEYMGRTVERVRIIKQTIYEAVYPAALDEDFEAVLDTGEFAPDIVNLHDVVGDGSQTPEEEYMKKELELQIMEHLGSLPPEQQEILQLKFFEDYTFKEIAEATGSSRRTVTRRYNDALASIKELVA